MPAALEPFTFQNPSVAQAIALHPSAGGALARPGVGLQRQLVGKSFERMASRVSQSSTRAGRNGHTASERRAPPPTARAVVRAASERSPDTDPLATPADKLYAVDVEPGAAHRSGAD
ncbi:hypothetical protein Q5752_002634 [Cryptotrichosporon argae]